LSTKILQILDSLHPKYLPFKFLAHFEKQNFLLKNSLFEDWFIQESFSNSIIDY